MSFLSKMCFLGLFLSSGVNASWSVDPHWNDPGITVRQPNVWSSPNVMVTDTQGRPAPSSNGACTVTRVCYPNGNCVLEKICK